MRPMAMVVYGVVVVVIDIIAMMGKFRATVPKMVGKVEVVVVDTSVNNGYHYALACVAQAPNLVGVHLCDI